MGCRHNYIKLLRGHVGITAYSRGGIRGQSSRRATKDGRVGLGHRTLRIEPIEGGGLLTWIESLDTHYPVPEPDLSAGSPRRGREWRSAHVGGGPAAGAFAHPVSHLSEAGSVLPALRPDGAVRTGSAGSRSAVRLPTDVNSYARFSAQGHLQVLPEFLPCLLPTGMFPMGEDDHG